MKFRGRGRVRETLIECDLGTFNFDGAELDSGTIVEFMVAKFADIPAGVRSGDECGRAGSSSLPENWRISLVVASVGGFHLR
jgi:hypothetical protein